MNAALIIFAKAPVAGQAKTRLIPALGAAGAAALAERLLEHTLAAAQAARPDALELCITPDDTPATRHPAFTRMQAAHRFTITAQGAGGLGQRMQRALARALQVHAGALLIGTDAPALGAPLLAAAAAKLHTHDAVFVPALDGGYALVGLRHGTRDAAALFEGVAWGTGQVMAQTRERAAAAGLRWAELEAVADIDEAADLVHLPASWLAALPGTALPSFER